MRTFLRGADLVLPSRVVSGGTLVVEDDRIADVSERALGGGGSDRTVDCSGRLIVPGFIDVHVHGVAGKDALDGPGSVAAIAAELPRYGVTAFCPTSVACTPGALSALLAEVGAIRARADRAGARVLPAHLESNFVHPEFRGAQPLRCLRSAIGAPEGPPDESPSRDGAFSARDVLAVIDRHRPDVAIVTMAPEIAGGMSLLRSFVAAGLRVSLGHSGASFDEAHEAIAAGASQATHLFNRMRAMSHRDPGLTGAVLASDDVAAELICDGHHVHPAVMQIAVSAKGPSRVMAITDGTAGSGLAPGSHARLGGEAIVVGDDGARLSDGTLAGGVLTMDRAFACLVSAAGVDLIHAAAMCSTTPARELGLTGLGVLAPGATADFVELNRELRVLRTWVNGTQWPGRSSR